MYNSSTFISLNENDKSIKIVNNDGKVTHIIIHYLCTLRVSNNFLIVEQSQEAKNFRLQFTNSNEAKIAHNKLRDALIKLKNNNKDNNTKYVQQFDSLNEFPNVGEENVIYVDNTTLFEYVYLDNQYYQLGGSNNGSIIEMTADPALTNNDIGKIIMNNNNLATTAKIDYIDKEYQLRISNGTYFKFPTFSVFALSIMNNPVNNDVLSINVNGYEMFEFTFVTSDDSSYNQILIGNSIYITMINLLLKLYAHPNFDNRFLITGLDYTTGNLLTTINLSFAMPGVIYPDIITSNKFTFNEISTGSINDLDNLNSNFFNFYTGDNINIPVISFDILNLIEYNTYNLYTGDFVIFYNENNNTFNKYYVPKTTEQFLYILGKYIESFGLLNYSIKQVLNDYILILKDKLELINEFTRDNYIDGGFAPYNWETYDNLNKIFFKKPIGVLKDIKDGIAYIDTSLIVNVRLDENSNVVLDEPNNNDNKILRVSDNGFVELYNRNETTLQPNFPYLIPLTNGNSGELIRAKWQDEFVPLPEDENIKYNFQILYVSSDYGDDNTAVNGNITRPYKYINSAINAVNSTNGEEYIIEILPGTYTENNIYLKHKVTLNFHHGTYIYGTFYHTNYNDTILSKIRVNGHAIHLGAKIFHFEGYYDSVINLEYAKYSGRVDLYGLTNSLNNILYPDKQSKFILNARYIQQTGYVQQYFLITHRGNIDVTYNLSEPSHIEAAFDIRMHGYSNVNLTLNFDELTLGSIEPYFIQSKSFFNLSGTNSDGKIKLNGKKLNYLYNGYSNLIGLFFLFCDNYKIYIDVDKIYTKNIIINAYGGIDNYVTINNSEIISEYTPQSLFQFINKTSNLLLNNCTIDVTESNNITTPKFQLFYVDNLNVTGTKETSPIINIENCKFYLHDDGTEIFNFYNRPSSKYNTNIYIYDTYIYYANGFKFNNIIEANNNTLPIEIMNYNLKSNIDTIHPAILLRESIETTDIILPDKTKFL